MKVVRFLERKQVIQFFGAALILAPFINTFLHIWLLQKKSGMIWAHFQIWPILKNIPSLSLFLAFCSVAIGVTLLSGATKAWRYVLIFLGVHLVIQILNVNDKAWKGPLAWPSFLLNAGLFFFIFDQLVWKVSAAPTTTTTSTTTPQPEIINLKSYRKILFSFGSTKPWGELKTLSSVKLGVLCTAEPPVGIENKIVQIRFAKDVIVDIQFDYKKDDYYYFKPLNMNKDQVTKLNRWLRKIAV